MTALISAGGIAHCDTTASALTAVQRTPLYFDSHGTQLFGWLHRADSAAQLQRGVLVCPPWGYEQVHAHRSLRHLADALARAGCVALRFDYHGTGDSAGTDADGDRHAMWLNSLQSARRWMEQELGFAQVSAVGLRVGATLVVQAASEMPFDDLVLWAPVIKGRAYVRELKAMSMAAGAPSLSSKEIEAAGFSMGEQTATDLSAIDLLQTRPQCRRALIVGRDDLPADTKLLDHLLSRGIETQQIAQPGYAGMMAEPHFTTVPQQAIAEISRWLAVGWVKSSEPTLPQTAAARTLSSEAMLVNEPSNLPCDLPSHQSAIRNPQSATNALREQALRLSLQPDLFGILTEPCTSSPPMARLPAIVLLNAGSAYRVGPNRLHVLLARRLAGCGFRCLRMDLAGLGDSVTPDLTLENDPYPATAFRDIDLAIRFLREQLGVERVILMGLCSGAYAAFQSAVQFQDAALVESVIINPLTYHWQEGMTVESAESLKFKAFHEGVDAARQPGKWLKLLTGRSKLGVAGAVRLLLQRWQLTRQARKGNCGLANGDIPTALPSHPGKNDLPDDLARIVKNGRQLAFFFSRSDPGHDILTFYAKPQVDQLCRLGQMRITLIDDADHTFSRRAAREVLLQAIVSELCSRYLAGAAVAANGEPTQ